MINKEQQPQELVGKIVEKRLDKVYNKKSPHYGNQYYRLQVELENNPQIKEILVSKNALEKKSIWQDLKAGEYYNKNYFLYCCPLMVNYQIVSYRLVNWKELENKENHGNQQ